MRTETRYVVASKWKPQENALTKDVAKAIWTTESPFPLSLEYQSKKSQLSSAQTCGIQNTFMKASSRREPSLERTGSAWLGEQERQCITKGLIRKRKSIMTHYFAGSHGLQCTAKVCTSNKLVSEMVWTAQVEMRFVGINEKAKQT